MSEAIETYRHVAASREFREAERMRSKALHDEAQALRNAERKRDMHWQGIVVEKNTEITKKDTEIAEMSAEIERLRALLEKKWACFYTSINL